MKTLNRCFYTSVFMSACLAAVSSVMGQNSGSAVFSNISIAPLGPNSLAGTINSAVIVPRVFNDAPGAIGTYVNSYPGSVSLSEANVQSLSGFADRDVWYYSANSGASAYNFQAGDYFTASFSLTLSGGLAGKDLEGGFLFSNPSGNFGGDCQIVAVGQGGNAGVVFQGGGPSYYPFSPLAGGYPGAGGSVPNYPNGSTYTFGLNYTIDPVTGLNAFQYSVNGQMAASAPGNDYFDLGPGQFVGSPGDFLGGYFQIQTVIVPEPSTLALLGLGLLPVTRLLRRRA